MDVLSLSVCLVRTASLSQKWGHFFYTTENGRSTSIGNFGRLKAQKVKVLARRSAHLKREDSGRISTSRFSESPSDESDEDGTYFERDRARNTRQNSRSRDDKTRGAHSLNSVLRQYRGADDLDFPGSEATSGSKRWGNISDVTFGRQNQRQKGPLDSGFFSRRSFKEIGCSDEILGALRSFGFPRPSHIQVNNFSKQNSLLGADISSFYSLLLWRRTSWIVVISDCVCLHLILAL